MAKQGLCRTGQVAQALGLSAHQVRRLCETGLVGAELGPGGHWRIPASEVARLQEEGIPIIPSAVGGSQAERRESENPSGSVVRANPGHNVLSHSSQTSISSDSGVRTPRNYMDHPKIALATTELEPDCFRERERQREENQTTTVQPFIDQQTKLQANTREQWHYRWLEWALQMVPWGVPEGYRLDVRQEVDQTLQSLQPQAPESLTRTLVEGAIQRGLRTWRSALDTEKALGDALRWLPWSPVSHGQPTKWQLQAKVEASSAIANLPDGASFETKLAAAAAVVQKITLEFQDETLRQKVIQESIAIPLLSNAETEDARAAIRTGVGSLRHGSSEAELRRARQAALNPFEDTHRQRENRQRLERNVDQRLGHILTFLDQLWADGELEDFGDYSEVWQYANDIRETVRAEILEELAGTTEVNDYKIKTMIEAVVDDQLSD